MDYRRLYTQNKFPGPIRTATKGAYVSLEHWRFGSGKEYDMSTSKLRLRSENGVELWRTSMTVTGQAIDEAFTVKAPGLTAEVWTFDQQSEAESKFDELALAAAS